MNSRHVKIGVAVVTAGIAIGYGFIEVERREAIKTLDKKKQLQYSSTTLFSKAADNSKPSWSKQ
jgi:hypothetical protein